MAASGDCRQRAALAKMEWCHGASLAKIGRLRQSRRKRSIFPGLGLNSPPRAAIGQMEQAIIGRQIWKCWFRPNGSQANSGPMISASSTRPISRSIRRGNTREAEYEAGHIPGAVHLDLATLKDDQNPVPGMITPAEKFAARMEMLGIGDQDHIVLYDNSPHRTSARAWWILRMFGATQIAILDGGLYKWVTEGRPLEQGAVGADAGVFLARRDPGAVRDLEAIKANVVSGAEEVVDARSAKRFTGEEADPRGLASGHIPGSKRSAFMIGCSTRMAYVQERAMR